MSNKLFFGLAAIMFAAALPVWAQDGGNATRGNTNFPAAVHPSKPTAPPEPASTTKQARVEEIKAAEPQAQPSSTANGANTTTKLQAGLDAHQKGDYPLALKLLIPLANKGDATAQLRLGVMNEMGQGVPQNHKKAVMRFRQAAEQGNAEAQYHLGKKYDLGQGVPRNKKVAIAWYRKSAAQGYAEAQAKVKTGTTATAGLQAGLDAYQRGDYPAALKVLIPLANRGDAAAQLHLGLMNEMGQGVPQNHKKAAIRYHQAAAQGNAEAQYHLGEKYDLGQGVPQNKKIAAEWYGKSASQGYAGAQARIKTGEEAQAKAEEQARLKAEAKADAEAKAAEQARAAEQEYWISVKAQAKRKAEAKAREEALAAEEARLKAEAKAKAEEEARAAKQADLAAKAKAREEAEIKKTEQARIAAEAKAAKQAKAKEEALAAEEAGLKAEAKAKAEEEARAAKQADLAAKAKVAKQAKAEEAKLAHTPADPQGTQVERSVKDWAAAWSARNVQDYLAAYVPGYKPEGMSHDAWKEQRIERISKPQNIEVMLSDINSSLQDDSHATVSLTQSYRSDSYHAKTKKTLRMVRQSDRWLIAEESAGNTMKIQPRQR